MVEVGFKPMCLWPYVFTVKLHCLIETRDCSLPLFLAFWLRSSGGSDGKRLSTMWETWVQSLGREVPWRRKWQPTPIFLPGESHGQRSLVGYSPWGRKESDTTEWLHFQIGKNEKMTYPNWHNMEKAVQRRNCITININIKEKERSHIKNLT